MAGEGEQEDGDFSFPTTTSSPPRFIGSPRLWRSSSYSLYLNQTKLTKLQQHEEEDQCNLTVEYRKAINLLSYIKHKDCDGNHENMDVIWEDLNYEDEIGGVKRRIESVSGDFGYEMPERGRKEKRYGEVAVAGGGGKRPSMVVLINVLKKFLLMSHVTRNVKK